MSVVGNVLAYLKKNPSANYQEILRFASKYAPKKDEEKRLLVVLAISKTFDYVERNPRLDEKKAIQYLMKEFSKESFDN